MSDEKMFNQDDVNRMVGQARMEARDNARKEIKDELQTSKDYETQIEALQEQVGAYKEKYEQIMKADLESTLSELSEDVKKVVNDYPGDADAKLAWYEKHKDVLNARPGNGVGNRSAPPAKIEKVKSNYKPRGL